MSEHVECYGHYGPGQLAEWDSCSACNPPPSVPDPAPDRGTGAETLATILHPTIDGTGSYCPWESKGMCPGWNASMHAARDILASDWLAARDAEQQATGAKQALLNAADHIRFTGQEHAEWLRDRAAGVRGEATP